MKVIHNECSSKKSTIRVIFDAGADVEYNGKWTYGIAHLVEHMAFQGTNTLTYEELTRSMATLGADQNAATYNDRVMFYVTIPYENAIEASKLLKDMLLDRTFDKALFEKEKLVVLEEERGGRDDIEGNIYEKLDTFLCNGPMSMPIIGTEKSIKSITFEEMCDFHKQHYTRDRLLLSITGPKELPYKEIVDVFGKDDGIFLRSEKDKNTYKSSKKKIVKDDRIEQARVFICYKACPINNKNALVLNFVDKFFTRDMDSRIFNQLRQKNGLCYSTYALISLSKDLGWYIICINTAKENIKKAIKIVGEEIQKLLKDGPTKEEMIRAKNKYKSETYSWLETSYGSNTILSGREYAEIPPIETSLMRVEKMSVKEVNKACEETFKEENKQVFIYMPKEKK